MDKINTYSPDSKLSHKLESTQTKRRRFSLNIVKIAVSGFLLYLIFSGTDLKQTFNALRSANIIWVLISFLVCPGVVTLIRVFRWRLLMRTQDGDASISFLFKSYMVSHFFSNMLPTTIGGDAIRIYDTWRAGISKTKSAAVIAVDRFLGILALVIIAVMVLPFSEELTGLIPAFKWWVIFTNFLMFVLIYILFFPSRRKHIIIKKIILRCPSSIQKILGKIIDALFCFEGDIKILIFAFLQSMVMQIALIVYHYIVAKALGIEISFYDFFLIIPVAVILMMLPISINAIGIRESIFIYFFSTYDIPAFDALAFSWLVYGQIIFTGVLGAVVFVFRKHAYNTIKPIKSTLKQ